MVEESSAVVYSLEEQEQVSIQLEKLLASRHFRNSQKYSRFLKFLVERALVSDVAPLKERVLAVEIFGRRPDFDASSDPVVRVTAGEVRKRIALYYQEFVEAAAIEIRVPVGGYIPEFRFPEMQGIGESSTVAQIPGNEFSSQVFPPSFANTLQAVVFAEGRGFHAEKPRSMTLWFCLTLCSVLLSVGISWGTFGKGFHVRTRLEEFWKPLLADSRPLLICQGDFKSPALASQRTETLSPRDYLGGVEMVPAATVFASTSAAAFLKIHNAMFVSWPSSRVTFLNLQQSSTVAIGTIDDPIIQYFNSKLPFRLVSLGQDEVGIQNASEPARLYGQIKLNEPIKDQKLDYAIVARLYDPSSNHTHIIIAGLGTKSIYAAGRMVRNDDLFDQLASSSKPQLKEKQNVEFVISIPMVNGIGGIPSVVAFNSW